MNTTKKLFSYKDNIYPLEIQWDKFVYSDLIIETEKVRNWCKEGCPNYNTNGGCPPFSPTVEELLGDKEFIFLTTKINIADINHVSSKEKSKLVEQVLCNFMDPLGYKVMELYAINFLNSGHCRGCKTCTINKGCSSPERRVNCITGIGIMLGEVIEKLFNSKLQWFTKDSEPEYIIKIMGFISEDKTQGLIEDLPSIIKNQL